MDSIYCPQPTHPLTSWGPQACLSAAENQVDQISQGGLKLRLQWLPLIQIVCDVTSSLHCFTGDNAAHACRKLRKMQATCRAVAPEVKVQLQMCM